MKTVILPISLVSLLCSCTVDVPDPGSGLFACEKDDDCSGDWYCESATGRCVDPNNSSGNLCGNDMLDSGEECDGPEPAGATCGSESLGMGPLGCDPDSCTWDTTSCWVPPSGWYGPATGSGPAEVTSGGLAGNSDIAIDSDGRPVVAYVQYNSLATFVVHAARFEGPVSNFENLNADAPLSDPDHIALRPRIAVAPDGKIGVVYRQATGLASQTKVHFRQLVADGWQPAVSLVGCTVALDCLHFDLVYDTGANAFMVAWSADGQIGAAEINAANDVTQLPLPSAGDTYTQDQPAIATNPDSGQTVVAWRVEDGTGQTAIYVKRWNADSSTWEEVSGGSASGGGVSGWGLHHWPSLGWDSSGPLALTWRRSVNTDTEGALLILDGNVWDDMGGAGNPAIGARPYIGFLSVVTAKPEPILVWQEGDSGANAAGHVAVSFWRNGAWRQAPEANASAGAIFIDESDQGAGLSQVATGPNGLGDRQMCVTWSQKAQIGDADFDSVQVRCHLLL